jgi:hypothetical protein
MTKHVPLTRDDVYLITGQTDPPLNIFDGLEAFIEPWAEIATHCDAADVWNKAGEVESKVMANRKAHGHLPSIHCHLKAILEVEVIVINEAHIATLRHLKSTIPHNRRPTGACSANYSDARVFNRRCRGVGGIINDHKLEVWKSLR